MYSIKPVLYLRQLYSTKPSVKLIKTINFSTISNDWIKTIKFQTCGQLYEKLRKSDQKLYRNISPNGVEVSVEYVDTLADNKDINSSDVKTILAIHGVIANYTHFNGLIEYFGTTESRVRVIAPNMPDFGLTRRTKAFWHSNHERSQLIRDFLKAINVSTIDAVVSHSSGIHSISMLWSEPNELTIRSVALFCPQSLWYHNKRLEFFCKLFLFIGGNEFGIKALNTIGFRNIANKYFFQLNFENTEQVLELILIYLGAEPHLLHQRLDYLKNHKIPTLVVFGDKDTSIEKSHCDRLLKDLGADQRDIIYYSSDNRVEKDSERENYIKVLGFRDGKHFCYNRFSDIVNKQLFMHLLSQK